MKVDIYRLGEAEDSWAVFVEGSVIEDLTGLTREQAVHHRGLIVASYMAGSGAVELPDTRPENPTRTEWRDTGSGPGVAWEAHDDPEQQP